MTMADHKRILLAEDNTNDAELTLAALAEYRLADEFEVFSDGSEILDYLYRRGRFAARASGHPAAIILDIKMPRIGGLEVLRIVKSDEQLKTIPVVMLTSSQEEGDVTASYQLGANAYVVKPVGFAEFSSAIKQVGLFWCATNEPPPGTILRQK